MFKNVKIRKIKNYSFAYGLCVYETWSLILREKHRLRVFENWILRRIFGSKNYEVVRG
jgi:hypothetical protein